MKKKVQRKRECRRGLFANVNAKTSGHREGREEAGENFIEKMNGIRDLVRDSDFFRERKSKEDIPNKGHNQESPNFQGDQPGCQIRLQHKVWGWKLEGKTEVVL